MFKVKTHATNGTADVSKTILHDKMLHYQFRFEITINTYNLPRSLQEGVLCDFP